MFVRVRYPIRGHTVYKLQEFFITFDSRDTTGLNYSRNLQMLKNNVTFCSNTLDCSYLDNWRVPKHHYDTFTRSKQQCKCSFLINEGWWEKG